MATLIDMKILCGSFKNRSRQLEPCLWSCRQVTDTAGRFHLGLPNIWIAPSVFQQNLKGRGVHVMQCAVDSGGGLKQEGLWT